MSAAAYLRRSPSSTALGDERVRLSIASIGCGAIFLPPDVTSRSFLRSVIAQVALVVDRADVAGVEPAVAHRVGRRVRLVVVAAS